MNERPTELWSVSAQTINRSGFGQRMPDGRIVWSHNGDKKAKH